ncbi:subtilase family protein [Anaerobacterium chartisolvens]|uniref:Subtilase family protein n=1 Tax=Anaerobacterium chartisolvens TaxID=1297424 RepID=A0A369AM15_9FIRM|nr:S8 family peptidase [Anaerobacterium chartisolvens]RCX10432.1 subtilase family protein [Anaerobacterium chartisolvens]
MTDERYSAKKVRFRQRDYRNDKVPSSIPEPAKWIYENKKNISDHLKKLMFQVNHLLKNYIPQKVVQMGEEEIPVPVIIRMHDRKLAKSHRPDSILNEIGSKIISIHGLGEYIIGVSSNTLEEFFDLLNNLLPEIPSHRENWIYNKNDKNGIPRPSIISERLNEYELLHELTSITDILEYSTKDVLIDMTTTNYYDAEQDGQIKVRFFNYGSNKLDNLALTSFIKQFQDLGIRKSKIQKLSYSKKFNTYIVPYISEKITAQMANFPGVEHISTYLKFQNLTTNPSLSDNKIDVITPKEGVSYPKVAIVDSGISPDNIYLKPWVTQQESFVLQDRQNNYHGDFIGGLLVYGHIINPELKEIVDSGVKILDIVVIPDPEKETIRENELIASLIDALDLHSEDYRVWNLSLGTKCLCASIVSDFTAAMDELQDTYKVIFIMAAGNYETLRDNWPVNDFFEDDEDRICIPADSVRAVTVGSIAMMHDDSTLVTTGNIAPYSRRGPGVGLSIKPEVVHFSGNPPTFPIKSINSVGKIIGDYGTSFSTPMISSILAEYFELYPNELSCNLARALLVHSAVHPITNKRVSLANDHYFYGFGIPKRLQNVLYGNEHEITLIYEGRLNYREGINWIKVADFPFPQSLELEDKKIRGEIIVTIAYEPNLIPYLGSQYCRCNIDLKLRSLVNGTLNTISKGCSAKEMDVEEQWEKNQMTKLLKWSSIKQIYFSSLRGTKGSSEISLELSPTWRDIDERQEIPFAVVITIRDPKKIAPVYSDVTKLLLQSFQSTDVNIKYIPVRTGLIKTI